MTESLTTTLRGLLERAKPSEWTASRPRKSSNFGGWVSLVQCAPTTIAKVSGGATDDRDVAAANADLIVAAINNLPALLSAAEAAQSARAVPVDEWPKVVDEPVLIFVVHQNAEFATGVEDLARWQGWHTAYWTDFNGGGWVWNGLCGRVTHVAPLPADPAKAEVRP
jgi:hypothetical protein